MMDSIPIRKASENDWVRETRFGRWFQTTNIWYQYVLNEAIIDFKQLLNNRLSGTPHILDAGCGQGLAFELLDQHFQPKAIIGVDIDKEQSSLAPEAAKRCQCKVTFENGTVCNLNIPDNAIDLIFCHQLLHHLSDQSRALEEFYRVLVPGGLILIGESCRSFLNSFSVRLLFRHPLQVHKTAEEYIELVKSIGFKIHDNDIKTSTPWWSRKDFGLTEKIGLPQKPREVTEILIIARKPAEKY
jgi:ubiquinone/menaquinone biosynthesis C-methylase UbiE